MRDWAERAVSAAEALGDRPLTAAALAVPALAVRHHRSGETRRGSCRAGAAALIDAPARRRARAPPRRARLARGRRGLPRSLRRGDAHASRALAIARATGQGELFPCSYQILGRAWSVRGR